MSQDIQILKKTGWDKRLCQFAQANLDKERNRLFKRIVCVVLCGFRGGGFVCSIFNVFYENSMASPKFWN